MTAHFRPGMMANGRWITPVQGDGAGFPDLVLVRNAHILFVELKTDVGDMDDKQIDWAVALWIAGADVMMWTPRRFPMIEKILESGP